MSTDFPWEEFTGGEFPPRFKFETPGQSVVGVITNIRVTDFGGQGDRTPELWIKPDDQDELSIVASQTRLRNALAEHKPKVGDRIAVVYTGDGQSSRAGFTPPKLFDVQVKPGTGPAAQAEQPVGEQQPVAASSAMSAADLI